MKWNATIFLLLLILHGPLAAQRFHKKPDSARVIIRLNNDLNQNKAIDSVKIIFDKSDGTGAGFIKKIFFPVNNIIIIDSVPPGKYRMTIICPGIYQQQFSEETYVYKHRKNNNSFRFRLQPAEAFESNMVLMPAEKINCLRLSIFHPKLYR